MVAGLLLGRTPFCGRFALTCHSSQSHLTQRGIMSNGSLIVAVACLIFEHYVVPRMPALWGVIALVVLFALNTCIHIHGFFHVAFLSAFLSPVALLSPSMEWLCYRPWNPCTAPICITPSKTHKTELSACPCPARVEEC